MSARNKRSGFTLVELMVALTLGAIVIASVYTLGANAARHFQEQQRISQLQLGVRIALDRVRRDAAAAGFAGSPHSLDENSCGMVADTPDFHGVTVVDRDVSGTSVLESMAGAPDANVHVDRLRLTGNYATGDMYLVREYAGTTINLQTNWQAFRRSFSDGAGGVDEDLFQATFRVGNYVRILHPTGGSFFAEIADASVTGPESATISIANSLPACADICDQCIIAPLEGIEYFLADAPADLEERNAAVTGPNTVLMRGSFDLSDGSSIAGTARPVLEWAIHFDAVPIVNTAALAATPVLVPQPDTTVDGGGALRASGIYALDLTVGARTPEQDPNFPWVAPMAGEPITRFHVFTTQPGAMRVRTARTEVLLPNVAYRGM